MSYSKNDDDEATIANVPKRTKGNNHMYFQNENFQNENTQKNNVD
jgi:hypothetical protein